MLISLLIPCMNRTYALKEALPKIIDSANYSPPVEIVVLNYSSRDDLVEYLDWVKKNIPLSTENTLVRPAVYGKKYYHQTHTRNVCFMASKGDYVIHLSAEALPTLEFVSYIRDRIEKEHPLWMVEDNGTHGRYGTYLGRFIVCERQEFINAGGYDERFEWCSPDDKDISMRLHRRGGKFEAFSNNLIDEIPTPKRDKVVNLDLSSFTEPIWVKRQMDHVMTPIYEENNSKGILVANEGKEWGKWEPIYQ